MESQREQDLGTVNFAALTENLFEANPIVEEMLQNKSFLVFSDYCCFNQEQTWENSSLCKPCIQAPSRLQSWHSHCHQREGVQGPGDLTALLALPLLSGPEKEGLKFAKQLGCITVDLMSETLSSLLKKCACFTSWKLMCISYPEVKCHEDKALEFYHEVNPKQGYRADLSEFAS